jgi:hypothetical protein
MGRRPEEPLVRIVDVEVISVRRAPLHAITNDEVIREGFLGMSPAEFIDRFFTSAQGIQPCDQVTRIESAYLDRAGSAENR